MNPFFVTGLPRSRTAWMANWLTTDKTLCVHDPICNLWPAVIDRRLGMSGPEVALSFYRLNEAHPAAPWVVVQRKDAKEAFEKVLRQHMEIPEGFHKFWAERVEWIARIGDHDRVLKVEFEALNYEDTAAQVWRHLLPEMPFDAARWNMLNDLNITQDIHKRKAREWPLAR